MSEEYTPELHRKLSAFSSYRRSRALLIRNEDRPHISKAMKEIFQKRHREIIAKLEAEYPDFPAAFDRLEG